MGGSMIGNPWVGLLHLQKFIPKRLGANKFLKINKKNPYLLVDKFVVGKPLKQILKMKYIYIRLG
jgi:hypothetical protein